MRWIRALRFFSGDGSELYLVEVFDRHLTDFVASSDLLPCFCRRFMETLAYSPKREHLLLQMIRLRLGIQLPRVIPWHIVYAPI